MIKTAENLMELSELHDEVLRIEELLTKDYISDEQVENLTNRSKEYNEAIKNSII